MRRSDSLNDKLPALDVVQAAALKSQDGTRWLVASLWSSQAVGILGGAPKCGKTWLALEVAISVATGQKVLGRFSTGAAGPVLLFAAEDAEGALKERLEHLASLKGCRLEQIPIHVIRERALRLDTANDRLRLSQTIKRLAPKLLILDPFVRLHRLDENSSQEVSGILDYLRQLQRTFSLSVMVIHHMRKASGQQQGLQLRGSGDFYAWLDSALYLRRKHGTLQLSVEHRSAPAPDPLDLELIASDGGVPHLALKDASDLSQEPTSPSEQLQEDVLTALRKHATPVKHQQLRKILGVRSQRLVETLRALEANAKVERTPAGWRLPNKNPGVGKKKGEDESPTLFDELSD